MPRKTVFNLNDYRSLFTFKELVDKLDFELLIKEFVVLDIDHINYNLRLKVPYRSDYFTVFLVEGGTMKFGLHQNTYLVCEGDIVFCPMEETFWIEEVSEDYKAKYLYFSVDYISEAGFNYKSNDILKSLSDNPVNIIKSDAELYRRMYFHINELQRLNISGAETDNYYYAEIIWHHFSLVIYEIENYLKKIKNPNSQNFTYREDELTTGFFILVREHYKEEHNVQFYADKLFISRKYLTKIINKTMMKSPRDIINQVLIVEAKLMLRSSNSNVNEVASALKFSDPASFSKFFKKHSGLSPQSYKKTDLF